MNELVVDTDARANLSLLIGIRFAPGLQSMSFSIIGIRCAPGLRCTSASIIDSLLFFCA